jgi:predicted negative regulator of RcsB-dependent stress response
LADFLTEEEQVEAFKNWWSENGLRLVAITVLLFGGYFGWQSWDKNQEEKAQQGSEIYMEMIEIVTSENPGQRINSEKQAAVNTLADQLKENYQDSGYGHFAALLKAKLAVDNNDLLTAASELRWVLDNNPESTTQTLALLRLARVEASRGDVQGALNMIQGIDPAGMKSAYEEAKGDFYVQLGDMESAYTAYQAALLSDQSQDSRATAILRLKLSQTTPATVENNDTEADNVDEKSGED